MAASAVTGYAAYSRSGMSDLMYANIEALTQDETTTDGEASELGRLMYREIGYHVYQFCCDRRYPDKTCGAADCDKI